MHGVYHIISVILRLTVPILAAVLLTSTPHNIKQDSSERGMNPVAMTIINLRKEYWQSQRFEQVTFLKSSTN